MGTTEKGTKTTAEVAREYFEAVARRDVEGMITLWRIGSGTGNIHGMAELRPPDDYRRWFGALFAAFPDMDFQVLSITTEDERAAVRWGAKGTFTGDVRFEGMLANGKTVEIQGIDLLTVNDGLIDSLEAYTNSVTMMRQLGALPDAGSGQEKAMLSALNLKTKAFGTLKRG